ncbi:zinc finger CCCH domain-containing protein 14 isoform X2 [Sitophilus oryzae]|uniref:Zinc finger CCCH domain-containing protein 14 n=1 Tax=Sitophilus oryzae TaxID=7048 RepID=A0A6J2YT17_SITOR|nr:zinc finger CCCH domain-containing protein 14 isoform X2 [Sitophilus oryzae]
MDNIGAEVGQKMRSAIKAKLMELDCYVDDELPDYIMVMVANRRSKSQMNDDLNLFLSSKTSTFVNWLHIVLKKLKEVTVTNPEIYSKVSKRKSTDNQVDDKGSIKLKKEKNSKKVKTEEDSEIVDKKPEVTLDSNEKSLTDDLPLIANKFSDKRRIVIENESSLSVSNNIVDDNFDIPLLSEVNDSSNEKELQDIERKIHNVKSRLGLLVESDNENDEEWINNQSKEEDNPLAHTRQVSVIKKKISGSELTKLAESLLAAENIEETDQQKEETTEKKSVHQRITFENDFNNDSNALKSDKSVVRKSSVLDRLGKRTGSPDFYGEPRKKVSLSEYRREEEKYTGSVRSKRRSSSRDRSRSRRYNDRRSGSRERSPRRTRGKESRKEGILSRLGVQSKVAVIKKPETSEKSDDEEEKIVREVPSLIKVKPRVIPNDVAAQANKNLLLKAVAEAQRSIAQTPTVGNNLKPDALYTKRFKEKNGDQKDNNSVKRIDEKEKSKLKSLIQQSGSRMRSSLNVSSDEYDSDGEYIPKPVRNVERCKYWPNCRQGDKCEFVHPSQNCEAFPHCKFREKCLFLHPRCKFGNSCTKRECPYDHVKSLSTTRLTTAVPVLQNCKFFPNCTNVNCQFYHPKPCMYGQYCKNMAECSFSHNFPFTKKNLRWKSK